MRKMYSTQTRHASRLMLFHGPLRASYPGWAPAVFNGLKDCKIIEPGTWRLRGLQHGWLTTKVRFIYDREPDRFYLALESDHKAQCQSVALISEQTAKHAPESIALFGKAVRYGNGYLLTDERLDVRDSATIADSRSSVYWWRDLLWLTIRRLGYVSRLLLGRLRSITRPNEVIGFYCTKIRHRGIP